MSTTTYMEALVSRGNFQHSLNGAMSAVISWLVTGLMEQKPQNKEREMKM